MVLLFATVAHADPSTNDVVQALIDKGILTPEEAAPLLKKQSSQAEPPKSRDGWLGPGVGRNWDIEPYGWIDAGVAMGTHLGKANTTSSVFLSSPQKTSRVGLQGQGDMGDGVTAGFYLAQQIMPGDATNGSSAATGASNALLNLGAYGWISKDNWGKISLGRQDNIVFDAMGVMDTRGGLNFGSSYSFWFDNSMFGGTATSKSGLISLDGSSQLSNTVVYETPTWKGITVDTMWSFGNNPGSEDSSSKKAIAIYYRGIKDLILVAGQLQGNNSLGQDVARTSLIGGNYNWNDRLNLASGYIRMENPNGHGAEFTKYSLTEYSVKYWLTPKLDLTSGLYFLSDEIDSKNSATQLSLVANYQVKKSDGWSVSVYGGVAEMRNKGNIGLEPMAIGQMNYNAIGTTYPNAVVTVPGQVQDAVMVGLMVKF